ncbi:contractile injection system protein, VgrG/Pvc8 family [Maridesulfovibrio sp.]|uniref:contractile injection system protein, VgrG/Pvc8 family n=1 Tax=Maridesulfovibrio sp. TaxID=2795000 RepID=UPI002A186F9C|nr:contractile injection system protein, VgrG/Pvc8 family [Maridesulfovibrio sp.]
MGLTHKPVYRVECNGNDITAAIQNDLISLTITDEAGVKSDSLDISINDKGYAVAPAGSQFKVWLGYGNAATFMGLYVLNSVRLSGPPDKMDIKAAGAPQDQSSNYSQLQTQKKRSWTPQTIGAMVATIAADHGLDPAVAADLSGVALPHIDQINESDMHLLTRIARDHDAIAKANAGKLIFAHKGQGKTVSGKSMPTIELVPNQVTSVSVDIESRTNFNTVVALWRDVEGARDVEEIAGSGEPVHRIRHIYPTPEAAIKAAKGKLEAFQRGKQSLSGSLPGRPELRAEGRLSLSGFRAEKNGLWSITRATHKLGSGGYVTSVEGERV